MITANSKNNQKDTWDFQLAKSYNTGYEHGLKDMRSRALVGLWREYLKFKDLDPDLGKLIRGIIENVESQK